VSFRLDTPLHHFGFFYLFGRFRMHISDDFVESIFVAIYGVFETRRERAAVTHHSPSPVHGVAGWWVGWVVAGWLVVGCWVWIIGFNFEQKYSTFLKIEPNRACMW